MDGIGMVDRLGRIDEGRLGLRAVVFLAAENEQLF